MDISLFDAKLLAWEGMEVIPSLNNHRNWPPKDFWWKVPVSFLLSSLHRPPPQGPSAVLRPILVDPSVLFWDRERKSLHVVRLARLRSLNILVFIIFCSWTFFSFLVLTPHCFPASVSTAPAQFLGPPCFPPWTLPLSAGRPGEHTLETKTKEDKDKDWQIQGEDSLPWTPQFGALSLDNHIFSFDRVSQKTHFQNAVGATGSITSSRQPLCLEMNFWSFLTKTKPDQAFSSHVHGKI